MKLITSFSLTVAFLFSTTLFAYDRASLDLVNRLNLGKVNGYADKGYGYLEKATPRNISSLFVNLAAKKELYAAKACVDSNIKHAWYKALAYLMIAEAHTGGQPAGAHYMSIDAKETWYPFIDAINILDKALEIASELADDSADPANAFIADISLTASILYEKLKWHTKALDGYYERIGQEKMSVICANRSIMASEKAVASYETYLDEFGKNDDEKMHLFRLVDRHLKRTAFGRSEKPIIMKMPWEANSLFGLRQKALEKTKVPIWETKEFQLADFFAGLMYKDYGLIKRIIKIIITYS